MDILVFLLVFSSDSYGIEYRFLLSTPFFLSLSIFYCFFFVLRCFFFLSAHFLQGRNSLFCSVFPYTFFSLRLCVSMHRWNRLSIPDARSPLLTSTKAIWRYPDPFSIKGVTCSSRFKVNTF